MSEAQTIRAAAVATLCLTLKWYLTLMLQGKSRVKAGSRPPEDMALFGARGGKQSLDGSQKFAGQENGAKARHCKEAELRWLRIVSNDIENIPIGLLLMWAGTIAAGSPLVHTAAIALFCCSRVAHTIAYALKLQPHRALAWFGGVVGNVVMAVNILVGAMQQ